MPTIRPRTYLASGLTVVAVGAATYGGVALTSASTAKAHDVQTINQRITPTTNPSPPPPPVKMAAPAPAPPVIPPVPAHVNAPPALPAHMSPPAPTAVPVVTSPPPAHVQSVAPMHAPTIPQGGGADGDADNSGGPNDGDGTV